VGGQLWSRPRPPLERKTPVILPFKVILKAVCLPALLAAVAVLTGCASSAVSDTGAPRSARSVQADVHTQLAWNYLQREQYEVAGVELDNALRVDPSNSKANQIYGLLKLRLGKTREAERHFRRAVQTDPNNLGAQEDYASFLCQTGRVQEAIAGYEHSIESPLNRERAQSRARAGLCLLKHRDFAGAEPYFRSALKVSPNLAEALAGMQQISFEQGNYLSARGYGERFVSTGNQSPQVLLFAARTEAMLGDQKAAQIYAKQLRIQFPDSPAALALRGN